MNHKKPVRISYLDGSFKEFPSIKSLLEDQKIWNTLIYLGVANIEKEYARELDRVHRMLTKGLLNKGCYIIGNGLVTKI